MARWVSLRRALAAPVVDLPAHTALVGTMWRAHRAWTVLGLASAVATGLVPNVMIVSTGWLVGSLPGAARAGLGSPAGHAALSALALFAAASVGEAVLVAAFRLSIHQLAAHYVPYMEDLLASATLTPDRIQALEEPRTAARIAAVAEASRENIHLRAVDSFLNLVQARVGGLVAVCLLFGFHWWAPLVILAGVGVLARTRATWHHANLTDLFTVTGTDRRRAEYLRGLAMEPGPAKEIRMFGLADWVVGRYAATWTAAMHATWRNRRRLSWQPVLGCAVLLVANAALIMTMAVQGLHDTVSIGRITVFVQATSAAIGNLGFLGSVTWIVARATSTIRQILALRDEFAAPSRPPAAIEPSGRASGPVRVTLRGVRFGYPGRKAPVLRGLDLDIPAGQSLAIVGANGAGKSTVLKLLCGLYAPGAGTITLDGRTPTGANDAQRVAVIFQDFVRYELPLADNIGFGDLRALTDRSRLGRAAASAGAADLATRTGWGTVLSSAYDGGTDLSGGQWQRVALARALTALEGGAGLLILDEPAAALDIRAEADLFDRFLEVTRGATTILVTHRLSGVRHAQRIVVLDGGQIVEDGSHDELIALGGRYARMFSLQAQRFAQQEADRA